MLKQIKALITLYRRTLWNPIKYARYIGVKVGERCDFQRVSFGSEPYLIEIGDHVQITDGVKFFTHGAAWVLREKNNKTDFFGKINIGNNVYIGNNALLMPGITIGSNVIVAAGAVVTKSIPDGMIVAGNPGRIVGDIVSFEKNIMFFNVKTKGLSAIEKKNYISKLPDEYFIKK